MINSIYVVGPDGRQIDPVQIDLELGSVTQVTDTQEEKYDGSSVLILTERDFIWVPDLELPLCVGDEIYLDNQSLQKWTVCRGWYEVDGNPAIYGWYLQSVPVGRVRSLYLKDLNSLTMVTPRTQFVGIEVLNSD